MKGLLEEAGYVQGDLDGCKLAKVENGQGQIMCPYLDCGTNVDDNGNYLLVTSCGDFRSQSTDGLLEDLEECNECGSSYDSEQMYYSEHNDNSYCECCYNDLHVNVNGEYYFRDSDQVVETYDGDWVLSEEAVYIDSRNNYYEQDSCTFSEYFDEHYHNDDAVDAVVETCSYDPDDDLLETCHVNDCTDVDGTMVHNSVLNEYNERIRANPELDL